VREVLRGSSHFRFVEKRHRRGEEDMKRGKSSISKARSYAEIGEFWDEHDLSKYWGKTRKVKFDVVLEPEATYYPVAKELSDKIESQARKEGISSYALVNSWLDQKLKEKRRRTG
jgi:CopG antitoxin of type II toxin-antitoxin system